MTFLPSLNALLNLLSALCLSAGYLFIRRKKRNAHRACLLSAFAASTLFLMSDVFYHWRAGVVRYTGRGWIRGVYFSILSTHTVLAIVIVPLVLRTFYLAFQNRFAEHRQWARWTLPLWFYVSVTGVVIYAMLY